MTKDYERGFPLPQGFGWLILFGGLLGAFIAASIFGVIWLLIYVFIGE